MRQTWRAALIMVAGLAGLAGCSSPPEQASTIPTQQTTASTPATTAAVTSPPGLATTAGPVPSTTAVATTESAPASGPVDGLPEPVLTNPTVRWTAARTGLSSAGGGHEFYLRLAADKSGAVLAGVIAGGEQTFVARINAADGTPAWTAPVDGYYQGVLFVAAGLIVFVAPSPIDGAPAVAPRSTSTASANGPSHCRSRHRTCRHRANPAATSARKAATIKAVSRSASTGIR